MKKFALIMFCGLMLLAANGCFIEKWFPHTIEEGLAYGDAVNVNPGRHVLDIFVKTTEYGLLPINRKIVDIGVEPSMETLFLAKYPDGPDYQRIRMRVDDIANNAPNSNDWEWDIGVHFYRKGESRINSAPIRPVPPATTQWLTYKNQQLKWVPGKAFYKFQVSATGDTTWSMYKVDHSVPIWDMQVSAKGDTVFTPHVTPRPMTAAARDNSLF